MTAATRIMVVGVDGSHPAQLATRWALTYAAIHGWPVWLVHAWTVGGMQDFTWISRRWLRADSEDLLRTALAAARQHAGGAVEVSCRSVEGDAGPALAEAARNAALLVLGTHHDRGSVELGATGYYCARRLTVPIAVISPAQPLVTIHNGQHGSLSAGTTRLTVLPAERSAGRVSTR